MSPTKALLKIKSLESQGRFREAQALRRRLDRLEAQSRDYFAFTRQLTGGQE